MNFLSAKWEHLLIASYRIEPDVLMPFVPTGTRIDTFEGHVFVSLVAFMFNQTRVVGIPVPFHTSFEEVNLRFYVSPEYDEDIRAVTFIKEIVPSRLTAIVANNLFSENYVALPMSHTCESNRHRYTWGHGDDKYSIEGTVDGGLAIPSPGTVGEFITEHYWGYSQGARSTLEYRVEHPPWQCAELTDYQVSVDFGKAYGREFSFLNQCRPHCVQYALGSPVKASFPKRLARPS